MSEGPSLSRSLSKSKDFLKQVVGGSSLLARFGLVALVAVTLIGLVVGQMLQTSVERQILAGSIGEAEVVARLGLQSEIGPSEMRDGLTPQRVRALELAMRSNFARMDVVEVTLWDLNESVVFASDTRLIGPSNNVPAEVGQATVDKSLAVVADVTGDPDSLISRHETLIQVYQPIRFGSLGSSKPVGVLRTSVPYGPVAEVISAETRRLYVVLAGALLLLYTVLFRLVANASSELRRQVDENEHQAHHDALTGLPNRTLFTEEVNQRLRRRGDKPLAVIVMDLDRFKEINDTLGHYHGDLLLMEVGRRLKSNMRATDTVARLGGDEFAILLSSVDTSAALHLADKIAEIVETPVEIEGLRLDVGASLGVAMAPDHGDDIAMLLQRADIAMYEAKRTGSRSVLYDPKADHTSLQQLALAGQLRRAMNEELVVYYQPKIDLATNTVCGFEALVRWLHPEHGLIPPDEFIPLAERSGLMKELTEVVLEQSLAQLHRWLTDGHHLHMAVNVSARGLHHTGLVDTVGRILTTNDVPAQRLVLEITETTIAADPEGARQVLQQLRARGVRISIDDFGTGYSSLAGLRLLPVNELKIDRQFVGDLDHPNGSAIVEYSVQLGHMLGLTVVAEGAERAEDGALLKALGCDVAQGYWYARPMPADEATTWLQSFERQHMAEQAPTPVAAKRTV